MVQVKGINMNHAKVGASLLNLKVGCSFVGDRGGDTVRRLLSMLAPFDPSAANLSETLGILFFFVCVCVAFPCIKQPKYLAKISKNVALFFFGDSRNKSLYHEAADITALFLDTQAKMVAEAALFLTQNPVTSYH